MVDTAGPSTLEDAEFLDGGDLGDLNVEFSFIIPQENYGNRAILFDSLVSRGTSKSYLHSTPNIWEGLEEHNDQAGRCFVLPCTSGGDLLEDAQFDFRDE